MALVPGTKLGPYEILSPLGAGGMGEVYRARDTRLGRDVAVKVLPQSLANDADRLRRFEQEARSVAALNHPNILAVHDIGTIDQVPYMVCELLEGETLRERLQGAALSSRRAAEIAIQTAHGLAAAHEKGIVHRDLKPDNIFLTKDGRVKILDFGLAKVVRADATANGGAQTMTAAEGSPTEAGQVLGTAGYMSPEQVRGLQVDHRSDIFSFGAILFEMLTGKRAFKRDTAAETMTAILKEDPPELTQISSGVTPALERVVHHCLEKNPEQRFQSARDLAFDLESLSQHSGSSARAVAQATPVQALRRYQLPIAMVLVLIAATVGYLAGHSGKKSSDLIYHQLTFRRGTILSARFAPDHTTVIYSASWDGKNAELYSTKQDGIESRPVGLSQVDLFGISPAGELAISLHPTSLPGFFGTSGTLGRTPLTSGTAPREMLDNVEWADWSPDGSNLLVVRSMDNENRLEYPTGNVIYKLASPGWISHPRISRDGKRVAFLEHPRRGDDRGSIIVIDSDGKGKKSFGDFPSIYGLAWAPKDDEVWFTADPTAATIDRRLMAVSLSSGAFRLLSAAPGDMVVHDVAPDGNTIISVEDRERKIFFVDPKQSEERDLTWLDRAVLVALSPDGKQVLFHEGGKGGGALGKIFLRQTDGSSAVLLNDGYGVALSPDQKFVLAAQQSNPVRFLLIPTGAGEVKYLNPPGVENPGMQGFAADSRHVVLAGNEPGHKPRTFLFDPDSNQLQPLTPEGVNGVVSQNGKFLGVRNEKNVQLLPLDGHSLPIDVKGLQDKDRPMQMSADGKSIFAADYLGLRAEIYRIDLGTGNRQLVKTLTMRDATGGFGITRVAITPDAQYFAYNTLRQLSELYVLEGVH